MSFPASLIPHEATVPELLKLRSSQWTMLYLVIHPVSVVAERMVAETPQSNNQCAVLTISDYSGDDVDILPDMTCFVGSARQGSDLGILRVRETPSGSTLKIGETSEINFTAGRYLTFIDDFFLWPRHIVTADESTFYMDYDVEYVDQHDLKDPTPILGTDQVFWLSGSSVQSTWDGSASHTSGSAIGSFSWEFPGAIAVSGSATATPTATYDSVGTYRVSCTLTGTNGKIWQAHRYVYVLPIDLSSGVNSQFILESFSTSKSAGGPSFSVTLFGDAEYSLIRKQAKVLLVARDFFSGSESGIGQQTGRENILSSGWISEESITWDPDHTSVKFKVEGPQYWLSKMSSFPSGIEDTDFADNGGGAPTRWTEMEDLTVDKALWHFLHWRTTATRMMDCVFTYNEWRAAQILALGTDLWAQIQSIGSATILADPLCDRFGRLFVQINPFYTSLAVQGAFPRVFDLTSTDILACEITPRIFWEISYLEVSGVWYGGGLTYTAIGAYSPGNVPGHFGSPDSKTELVLPNSQTEVNELAGVVAGAGAGPIVEAEFELAGNYRLVDITPYQKVEMTISSEDNVRGLAGTFSFYVEDITFDYDEEASVLTLTIFCKGVGIQLDAVAMTFPGNGEPVIIVPDEPPIPPVRPPDPPPDPVSDAEAVLTVPSNIYTTSSLDEAVTTWYSKL